MGVSIFSGYITTLGSGIFLLLCSFQFFFKFGLTISLTVTFAFFVATFTFGSLMHLYGPENDNWDIFRLFRDNCTCCVNLVNIFCCCCADWCLKSLCCLCCKKKEDEDEKEEPAE